MSLFRRTRPAPAPVEKPHAKLLDDSPSQVPNVLGRGLNAVLPQEKIVELRAQVLGNDPTTPDQEPLSHLGGLASIWLYRNDRQLKETN